MRVAVSVSNHWIAHHLLRIGDRQESMGDGDLTVRSAGTLWGGGLSSVFMRPPSPASPTHRLKANVFVYIWSKLFNGSLCSHRPSAVLSFHVDDGLTAYNLRHIASPKANRWGSSFLVGACWLYGESASGYEGAEGENKREKAEKRES